MSVLELCDREIAAVGIEATVADAILDRLVHNAYRLELKGETMRKNTGAGLPNQTPSEP